MASTGNVRVFSRVRLLLPGQGAANSVVEYIGEDGELVVRNPVRNSTKPGKDFCMFKFNKVYTPAATQGVFIISSNVFTYDVSNYINMIYDSCS